MMAALDNTFEKIKSGVIAVSDYTFEKTKAGVVAASDYSFEKTKEGLAYAASDSAKHDIQQGLKTISKNIDAAADSLEKKEPTAWEKTKTGVSDTVDGVTQGVQEGWESLTAKGDSVDKK